MEQLEGILSLVEYILVNKERRHVVGGMLLSMAALFCGLAITMVTV